MVSFLPWRGLLEAFCSVGWLLAALCGMVPTKDRSRAPAVEVRSLNYWTTGKFLTLRVVHPEPLAIHELQFRFSYPVLTPHSSTLAWKSHGWRSLVATVPGVAKSWTWLSNFTHFHWLLSWFPFMSLYLGSRCPLFVCIISPVGGSNVPYVLPCLMDTRTTIDFSICSAFYLLLGWSNDLPIITKEIEKERKESVKCCRVNKANCETVVNPTPIQLQNIIPNVSAKMGTIHGRWAQLRTETVWT